VAFNELNPIIVVTAFVRATTADQNQIVRIDLPK
jgi:hypothetical protein